MNDFVNSGPQEIKSYKYLDSFFMRSIKNATLIYDHGCGYGGWTNYLSLMSGAKASIYDPDEDAYNYTKKMLGNRWIESEGPFDAILCFAVLELLNKEEQKQLLTDFSKKLRGRLIIQYNFYNPISPRWLMIRLLKGNAKDWHEKFRFHRSYLGMAEVEKMFTEVGFRIVERCTPILEPHLPRTFNALFAPLIPRQFHSLVYYSLEKEK